MIMAVAQNKTLREVCLITEPWLKHRALCNVQVSDFHGKASCVLRQYAPRKKTDQTCMHSGLMLHMGLQPSENWHDHSEI